MVTNTASVSTNTKDVVDRVTNKMTEGQINFVTNAENKINQMVDSIVKR